MPVNHRCQFNDKYLQICAMTILSIGVQVGGCRHQEPGKESIFSCNFYIFQAAASKKMRNALDFLHLINKNGIHSSVQWDKVPEIPDFTIIWRDGQSNSEWNCIIYSFSTLVRLDEQLFGSWWNIFSGKDVSEKLACTPMFLSNPSVTIGADERMS